MDCSSMYMLGWIGSYHCIIVTLLGSGRVLPWIVAVCTCWDGSVAVIV